MDKKYAIDANILISAYRLYYPFDVAPAFWRQLTEKGSGSIVLVDRIRDEILKNEDQLSEWLKENVDQFYFSSSQDSLVIETYSKIMSAVNQHPRYHESAKREFADVADAWLCAHALTHSYIVVTEEIHEPNRINRIKIPGVCEKFGISYIDRLWFIREIGIRFE